MVLKAGQVVARLQSSCFRPTAVKCCTRAVVKRTGKESLSQQFTDDSSFFPQGAGKTTTCTKVSLSARCQLPLSPRSLTRPSTPASACCSLRAQGLQDVSRLRRHVPCRCLRPAEAERDQGQDPVLWLVHRDGSGHHCPGRCREVQEGADGGHHCRHEWSASAGD